ncbi:hypothetical protein [Streptomyces hawaiiensis]|uniref:hypothetical protein n=1 Tax=Streptomyces hawaiiensis TaxID=67305 RepID=UPI001FE9970A|nr:hypothetical protein [Streptomyces hawaiiensis]
MITSTVYKTARDDDGNHRSEGQVRDAPWVAIAPVVNAIRVLERMVPPGQLLFDHHAHDLRGTRAGTGSLTVHTLGTRVEDFITWANHEAAARGLVHEVIPPDPHGRIGTERFRRSLAWHIARRPGGLVALAIQYGHLRTSVAAGYAARSRDGIHDLLDVETARATIDTVADLNAALEDGLGISGPAARRAIKAAATAPQYTGTVITARQARQILANPHLAVYDNPHTLLMCVYKRDKALCHRGLKDTPSLDRCVPVCENIARTDQHSTGLRLRATALDQQGGQAPGPLGERLRNNAARLRDLAVAHHRTRISLQDGTATAQRAHPASPGPQERLLRAGQGCAGRRRTPRSACANRSSNSRSSEPKDAQELSQLQTDVDHLVRAVNQLTVENRQLRGALSQPTSPVRVLPTQPHPNRML